MSTRCEIKIWSYGVAYKIYRHSDGYPEGVLADLKAAIYRAGLSLDDAEYFLANFIFLAKYNALKRDWGWQYGYGVCTLTCEHGDVEYKYELWQQNGDVYIKIEELRSINGHDAWVTVFEGKIEDAIEKYSKDYDGCHIIEIP